MKRKNGCDRSSFVFYWVKSIFQKTQNEEKVFWVLSENAQKTQNKEKVLLDFFQKIAVSKGRAFGRTPQSAKYLFKRTEQGGESRQRFRWGSEHDRSPFFAARGNTNIPDVPVARRGRSKLFFQAKPSTKSSPFPVQNVPPERFEALPFHANFKREGQSCLSLPRNAVAFLTHSPRFLEKGFRCLRTAPKGSAFGFRDFLKKIE